MKNSKIKAAIIEALQRSISTDRDKIFLEELRQRQRKLRPNVWEKSSREKAEK